MEKCNKVSRN